jgi:DNA-binding MarR family transcriptional regulator
MALDRSRPVQPEFDGEAEPQVGPPDAGGSARLGFLLQRAHLRFREAMLAALEGSGLNLGQLSILATLAARNDLSQRQLGAATGIEKSSMVLFVDALERGGWVERREHPTDRRAQAIHLTPVGLGRLAVVGPRVKAVEAGVLEPFTAAERDALFGLLRRLDREAVAAAASD